jgi:histone arginine demethylase JMJD6
MGTHAWVTVVEGCKRWVLFHPSTDLAAIGMQDPQIPSSIWFSKWYPKIMPKHPNAVEVLQYPGETVYVPAGWPHLVLNLEDTVAITQNYATEYPNVHQLVDSVQKSEPELFQEWFPKIKERRPDLFIQVHNVVQNTMTEVQRDRVLQEDEKKE